MARFYTDENFPRPVIAFLRAMGHDVLTAQEAGNANLGIPDPEVLAFAASNNRAVLTGNQRSVSFHAAAPSTKRPCGYRGLHGGHGL